MQKSKTAVLVAITAAMLCVVPTMAFADEGADDVLKDFFTRAVSEGAGIAAVSGFGSGAIMPLIFVLGKHVKAAIEGGKSEQWDWSQFLVTIASGTLLGYALFLLGLPVEMTTAGIFPWLLFYIKVIHPVIRNAHQKPKTK